jgi:RNA polymerase sigma-70 factor (ECF subfamily)
MAVGTTGADPREARARAGDRDALGSLLAEQAEPLRRWVERRLDGRLRGRVSASDVVQETCLAADARRGHLAGLDGMPLGVWLRLIAAQRLADLHRRHLGADARDARREVALDAGSGSAALAGRLAGDITSPSAAAARHEVARLVAVALRRLAPADREILELRHLQGVSNDEAAARLGLSKSAATKRHLRALERLRPLLEALAGSGRP